MMINHKFQSGSNVVEFRNIRINDDGHLVFSVYVNGTHRNDRFIHKNTAQIYDIYEAYKQGYPMNDNKVYAMAQRYL